MATKSDFAQKLLHDLRLKKEQMAAAQNPSQKSNQMSRGAYTSPGKTQKSGRQINAPETHGSRTSNSLLGKSNGRSRSINIEESSKQIVLYQGGQNSRQVGDLSMAIAFAFENGGNLSKIGSSSNNPLVNFFNRFGHRSTDSRKMQITGLTKQSPSTNQFPTVSHIHITEIQKGVQKLNQVLRVCSNGLHFDRNSIEVGKELLKGAMDLEESLRMLVKLQEASEHTVSRRQKNRIMLLDENEDEEDNTAKLAEQNQLDRPKFSFDRPYHNESSRQPVRSDFNILSTFVKPKSQSSPVIHKGRVSNVIAKLMGLEELPEYESPNSMQKDSSSRERKTRILRTISESPEPVKRGGTNASTHNLDRKVIGTSNTTKHDVRAGKNNQLTPSGDSELLISNKNSSPHTMRVAVVGTETDEGSNSKTASTMIKSQQSDNGQIKERETEIRQTSLNHVLSLKVELQHKVLEKHRIAKDNTTNNTETKVRDHQKEKRNLSKVLNNNLRNTQDHCEVHQLGFLREAEHSEGKHREGKGGKQIQNVKLFAKRHEGYKVEPIISPKKKRNTTNFQKKQSYARKSKKSTESMPPEDSLNSRKQKDGERISKNGVHPRSSIKEDEKQPGMKNNASIGKPEIDVGDAPSGEEQTDMKKGDSVPLPIQKKAVEVQTTEKEGTCMQVQARENPRKKYVTMTRKARNLNDLTARQQQVKLQDMKHNKVSSSEEVEQLSDDQSKESETNVTSHNESEITDDQLNQLQIHDEQTTSVNNSAGQECKSPKIMNMTAPSDSVQCAEFKCIEGLSNLQNDELVHNVTEDEKPDQSIQADKGQEERFKSCSYHQDEFDKIPEQLTEDSSEEHLKEILSKSQLLLNTAEALFNLDSPVSSDDHKSEQADKKLILDCGYEVIRRKARRQELKLHSRHGKIRSVNDLVKQLCNDLDMLKSYGGKGNKCDVAEYIYKMLDTDIYNRNPDVNSMWELGWDEMKPEKDDIIRDVEKHALNGLLDETIDDLLLITV